MGHLESLFGTVMRRAPIARVFKGAQPDEASDARQRAFG